MITRIFWILIVVFTAVSCRNNQKVSAVSEDAKPDSLSCCISPSGNTKFALMTSQKDSSSHEAPEGMVYIRGGEFNMGGRDRKLARSDEFPVHRVKVNSFYMDEHEVTNKQFREFVKATGYITVAEKPVDWEEMKKTLPPGTPEPSPEDLAPGSIEFNPPDHPVPIDNAMIWWKWSKDVNWKQPEGPGSNIDGMDEFPVVHVCWIDAKAYADWAGKSLPTEAQWEYAARGGNDDNIYPWGNEAVDEGKVKANSWQGNFPDYNSNKDGFYGLAPVKSFAPNDFGLYDMAGNVWEWCSDWYRYDYYSTFSKNEIAEDPAGPDNSYDPMEPLVWKKTIRGGSYLCNDSYCSGYRAAARMKSSTDSGAPHIGFRCVRNAR